MKSKSFVKNHSKLLLMLLLVGLLFVPDPVDSVTAGIPIIEAAGAILVAWKYNP